MKSSLIKIIKKLIRIKLILYIFIIIYSILLRIQNYGKSLQIGSGSILYKCTFGKYVTLYQDVECKYTSIGDFTYITRGTRINRTKIGKFCSIGPDCKIGLGKHPSERFVSTHPAFFSIAKQAQISFVDENIFKEYEEIIIGNDVWIGANVIILDGITVGNGAIIAAGSVVTKSVPAYAIIGGIPAKVIKYRFEEDEIKKLEKLKWWNNDLNTIENSTNNMHNIKDFLKI